MKGNIPIKTTSNIHKIAPYSTTYRFCIQNPDSTKLLAYKIQIVSGIELMDLHLLPDNSDAENLALEITWIQEQQAKLQEQMKSISGMKESSKFVSENVGSRMNMLAMVFILLVVAFNGFFYMKFKAGLKARKMI